MPEILVPIEITYQTAHGTPIKDVVAALNAAEILIADAVDLLPSFAPGAVISFRGVTVRQLSQQSPLKEMLIAALLVATQSALEDGVVSGIEHITGVDVAENYRSLLTLIVLVVLFYGAAMARDVVNGMVKEGPARRTLNGLIADMAKKADMEPEHVRRIVDAKYAKPGPVKALIGASLGFFRPSHREGAAPVTIGPVSLTSEVVADVPLSTQVDPDRELERYEAHNDVLLDLHAQDKDKAATGWAAVAKSLSSKRLRMKVMPPLEPDAIWGKTSIRGDIVVVLKLTSDGYEPSEIHLTAISGPTS